MAQQDQERLLNEILPSVAAQLRGSLGNMHVALLRMTPAEGADAVTERNMAILSQSYYRAMRLVNNLSAAPMLLETTPFLTANVELVAWLSGLVRQAQPLAEEAGIELVFACSLLHHSAAIHKEHMERLVWNLLSNAIKFTEKGGKVGLFNKLGNFSTQDVFFTQYVY